MYILYVFRENVICITGKAGRCVFPGAFRPIAYPKIHVKENAYEKMDDSFALLAAGCRNVVQFCSPHSRSGNCGAPFPKDRQ